MTWYNLSTNTLHLGATFTLHRKQENNKKLKSQTILQHMHHILTNVHAMTLRFTPYNYNLSHNFFRSGVEETLEALASGAFL